MSTRNLKQYINHYEKPSLDLEAALRDLPTRIADLGPQGVNLPGLDPTASAAAVYKFVRALKAYPNDRATIRAIDLFRRDYNSILCADLNQVSIAEKRQALLGKAGQP
jgi:hypothetical protein